MNAETYVVVGAGPAGARAVEALRGEGFDGQVVVIGEEEHRPYERPPLSKGYLAGDQKREEIELLSQAWFDQNDVELLLGRPAVRIDPGARVVHMSKGERVGYDRLLLTTGSAVRRLPVPGADLAGVLTLRSVGDSDAIRDAIAAGGPLVVVGGGWLGLEVAGVARSAGLDVTLVEVADQPLAAVLGADVGEQFAVLHQEHGVDVRVGTGVTAFRGTRRVEAVELADGSVLPAAAVVTGVGIRPRTELAESAGLAIDNGVVVDAQLRTSDPRIWAAGDVANAANDWVGHAVRVEHFANAEDQGRFVGRAIAGAEDRWGRPPFFWSDQYDAGLEYRGWADPASARVVRRGSWQDGAWMAFWLDGDRIAAGMHVNAWDDADTVKALVTERAAVDVDRLSDPATPLDAVRG